MVPDVDGIPRERAPLNALRADAPFYPVAERRRPAWRTARCDEPVDLRQAPAVHLGAQLHPLHPGRVDHPLVATDGAANGHLHRVAGCPDGWSLNVTTTAFSTAAEPSS